MKKFSEIDKNYIDNLEVENSFRIIEDNIDESFCVEEQVSSKSNYLCDLVEEVIERSNRCEALSNFSYNYFSNEFGVTYALYKPIITKMKESKYLIEIDNLNIEEFGRLLILFKTHLIGIIGISGKLYTDENLYFRYMYMKETNSPNIIKNDKKYEWFGRLGADIADECINILQSKITKDFCEIRECKIKNLQLEVFTKNFKIQKSKIKNCSIDYRVENDIAGDIGLIIYDCSIETLELKIYHNHEDIMSGMSGYIKTFNIDLSEIDKTPTKMLEIDEYTKIDKINIIISSNGSEFKDLKTLDEIIKKLFINKILEIKELNSKEAILKMEVKKDMYEIPVSLIIE